MPKEKEELKVQSSQATPRFTRVELKVSGANCCDGCRRKVLKALSIKGVLRTELHATADERVAVIGDVDGGRLVRRLAKVGKIAEVILVQAEVGSKKHNGGGGGGDDGKALPTARGSGDAGHAAADGKCGHEGANAAAKNGVRLPDNGGGHSSAAWKGQREGDRARAGFNGVSEATMCYDRAEPPMVVPVHLPCYAANFTMPPPRQQYGVGSCYYAMPPLPLPPQYAMPPPPPSHCRHPQVVRPQPTRFVDDDVFSDDSTVGCHVM